MSRRGIIFSLLVVASLLYITQMIGIRVYETREVEWLFTPSHFFGGMTIGLIILYLARGFSIEATLVQCLFAVLTIGIAWEVWEYVMHFGIQPVDTISDIVADLLGGYSAYALVHRRE